MVKALSRLTVVKIAVFLPERMSFMFVGAAEMAGCVMFHQLRRIGIERRPNLVIQLQNIGHRIHNLPV